MQCYRFDRPGDARLTAWMRAHVQVAIAEHANPEAIETDLIKPGETAAQFEQVAQPATRTGRR